MKISKIKKRDGRIVDFDKSKITNAIFKAARAVGGNDMQTASLLTEKVVQLLEEKFQDKIPSVEDVQDTVEKVLIEEGHAKTAKAYILYRDQHAKMREFNINEEVKLIDNYLQELDWQVKENSNMTYSLQGLNNYISSEISKKYWLNKIYPPEIRNAYLKGDFHIHDLGLLSVYCVGWDLFDLLMEGFKGVSGKT